MAITWPQTLPNPSYGFAYEPVDNTVRSSVSAGVPLMRRRFTNPPTKISGQLELTNEQVDILDDFVEVQLKDVLPFQLTDFRNGNIGTYRFVRRPSKVIEGFNLWTISFELELLFSTPTPEILP